MPTTPGQLLAAMRERNTPAADLIEDEIESYMKTIAVLESDGSFEMVTQNGKVVNPAVLTILRDRYGRPDGGGWDIAFHDPNLIQLTPQKPKPAPPAAPAPAPAR